MSKAFFKLQSPVTQQEMTDYDFSSGETPDGIFVNLGTNDCLINEEKTVEFNNYLEELFERMMEIEQEEMQLQEQQELAQQEEIKKTEEMKEKQKEDNAEQEYEEMLMGRSMSKHDD